MSTNQPYTPRPPWTPPNPENQNIPEIEYDGGLVYQTKNGNLNIRTTLHPDGYTKTETWISEK